MLGTNVGENILIGLRVPVLEPYDGYEIHGPQSLKGDQKSAGGPCQAFEERPLGSVGNFLTVHIMSSQGSGFR